VWRNALAVLPVVRPPVEPVIPRDLPPAPGPFVDPVPSYVSTFCQTLSERATIGNQILELKESRKQNSCDGAQHWLPEHGRLKHVRRARHRTQTPVLRTVPESVGDSPRRNFLAMVGLALAVVSFIALWFASVGTVFVLSTFLAIPGLLISLFALRTEPRRAAVWGVGLACFVCLYLPTMLVALR